MSPLHAAALEYASQGIPVFPVNEGAKTPACLHGFKDATTEPAIINIWWGEENPNYNIGTEPAAFGCTVIDLDNKNGHNGSATWSRLCEENGDPPETQVIRTPNGFHIWFKGIMPSSAGMYDGIDVRSIGAYVLMPPSIVYEREYVVICGGGP